MALSALEIMNLFQFSGKPSKSHRFGSGHINDTYRIVNADKGCPDYLLQRINDHVFKDVDGLMSNICAVTGHISAELEKMGYDDIHHRVLQPVRTTSGHTYTKVDGKYWRVYHFMQELKAYDVAETSEQVYEGGKAFGQFLRLLGNYPANTLSTTIKDFHNVLSRLDLLVKAINDNPKSKDPEVGGLIKFIFDVSEELSEIEKLRLLKKIPIRVTHNDTKFNNVLLNQSDQAMCVIDLDTVMPGLVHYDFGDGIRTGAATAEEDEKDLEKVDLDLEKFEAFSAGYLETTHDLLLPIELEHLALSSALLSYLMSIRFLTDYLTGNNYYKLNYPMHNLVRALNQGKLTAIILKRKKELNQIIVKRSIHHEHLKS